MREVTFVVSEDDCPKAIDQLCRQFIRTFRMMKRSMARAAEPQPNSIEFPAYALLACVVQEGPMRATTLAETIHVDLSTISRQAAALVQHGLLERQADPADGRASLLAATPEGKNAFAIYQQRHNDIVTQAMRSWRVSQIYQLASLLEQFVTDFEKYESPLDSRRSAVMTGRPSLRIQDKEGSAS